MGKNDYVIFQSIKILFLINILQPKEYNFEVAKNLENHWRPLLEQSHKVYSENQQVRKEFHSITSIEINPVPEYS
jgi:hypothetical protein